jgi:hypothetical protein
MFDFAVLEIEMDFAVQEEQQVVAWCDTEESHTVRG